MKIAKQGVEEGLFDMEYPEEVVTFLMMGSHFMGDVNIYLENRETYIRRMQAVLFVVQRVLGIDSETMTNFTDKYIDKFIKLLP